MLYLNVPYEQKDEAKSMYARWDNKRKKWFATNSKYYYRLAEWIEGDSVVQNSMYIAVSSRECWKCGKETLIYALAVRSEDLIDIVYRETNIEEAIGYDVVFLPISSNLPKEIKAYLEKHTNCKEKYSQTIQDTYFANTCTHCKALQGDYFVYEEFDSPFNGMGNSKIKYIEFKLEHDLAINYQVGEQMISPPVKKFNDDIIQSNIVIS
jgi:hypothetical protein